MRYEVTTPKGRRYEVTLGEGDNLEDIVAQLEAQEASEPQLAPAPAPVAKDAPQPAPAAKTGSAFRAGRGGGIYRPPAEPSKATLLDGEVPAETAARAAALTPAQQEAVRTRLAGPVNAGPRPVRGPDPVAMPYKPDNLVQTALNKTLRKPMDESLGGAALETVGDIARGVTRAPLTAASGLWGLVDAGATQLGADGVADFASRQAADRMMAAEQYGNRVDPNPVFQGAAESLTQAAVGRITGLVAVTAGNEYNASIASGLKPNEALERASVMGLTEALGERFGTPQLANLLRKSGASSSKDFRNALVDLVAKDIGGELGTYAMQSAYEKYADLGMKKGMTAEQFVDGALGTVQASLAMSTLAAGTAAAGRGARAGSPSRLAAEEIDAAQPQFGAAAPFTDSNNILMQAGQPPSAPPAPAAVVPVEQQPTTVITPAEIMAAPVPQRDQAGDAPAAGAGAARPTPAAPSAPVAPIDLNDPTSVLSALGVNGGQPGPVAAGGPGAGRPAGRPADPAAVPGAGPLPGQPVAGAGAAAVGARPDAGLVGSTQPAPVGSTNEQPPSQSTNVRDLAAPPAGGRGVRVAAGDAATVAAVQSEWAAAAERATAAGRADIAAQIPRDLRPVTDQALAQPLSEISAAISAATGFEGATGKPVLFVESDTMPDGLNYQGRAVVNIKGMQKPAVFVAGHEISHTWQNLVEAADRKAAAGQAPTKEEADAKRIWGAMEAVVWDMIPTSSREAYAYTALGHTGTWAELEADPIKLREVRREMLADFHGKRLTDKATISALAKREPALFGDYAKSIIKWIDTAIAKLRGTKGGDLGTSDVDKHIKDLTKAKLIWQDAMVSWRKRGGAGLPVANDATPSASARTPEARTEGETDKAFAKRVVDKRERPADLPETYDSYFKMDGAQVVPLSNLVSTKSAEQNQQGGDNGPKRMAAAAAGELSKRAPITVMPSEKEPGKYEVVDGNGTLTSVQGYGWKALPVKVVSREEGAKAIAADKREDDLKRKAKEAAPFVGEALAKEMVDAVMAEPVAAETVYEAEMLAKAAELAKPIMERAAQANDDFGAKLKRIAEELGAKPKHGPLKKIGRTSEKLVSEYMHSVADNPSLEMNDGFAKATLKDLVRGSLIFDSEQEALAAVDKVRERYDVLRVKDRFAKPLETGYRDILINVRLDNGTVAEIQLHIPGMFHAKDLGHEVYGIERAKPEGKAKADLVALQARFYDAAYSFSPNAARRSASISTTSSSVAEAPLVTTVEYPNGRPDKAEKNSRDLNEPTTGWPSTSNNAKPGSAALARQSNASATGNSNAEDTPSEQPIVNQGSLYVSRKVVNAQKLHDWAVKAGIKDVVPADKMHVTVVYSRAPVAYEDLGQAPASAVGVTGRLIRIGKDNDIALTLSAPALKQRHAEALEKGASWDFAGGYTPHISLSYRDTTTDISKLSPPVMRFELGPEKAEPLKSGWADTMGEEPSKSARTKTARGLDLSSFKRIDIFDLVGKTIFPTIADRTATGGDFIGIDGSKIDAAVPLQGGPFFPFEPSNADAKVVWANRGKGIVSLKKARTEGKDDVLMAVLLGSEGMHASNMTVAKAYLGTLEAYIRDGRIAQEALPHLNEVVRRAAIKAPDDKKPVPAEGAAEDDTAEAASRLAAFPGFEDLDVASAFLDALTFSARSAVIQALGNKKAATYGGGRITLPNMSRILRETMEADLAGGNWGDAVLVVRPTGEEVQLGQDGTRPHLTYPVGMKGEVVGVLKSPISWKLLFQDFRKKSASRTEGRGKTADENTMRYDFQRSLPMVEVTQELAERVGAIEYKEVRSAKQAIAAIDFAAGNWRTSDSSVKDGGVSQQEFLDALEASDGAATLSTYEPKELKALVKDGSLKIHQLGDHQIFFGLKKGAPWYRGMPGIKGVKEDEVELVSVVNNEPGIPGIAGPAILTKAIEDGATMLDAYSVKTERFPDGFLPTLYSAFGFEKVGEIPFDPQYAPGMKLADLEAYWSRNGWSKGDGYPPIAVMKWKGKDRDREGFTQRYLREGAASLWLDQAGPAGGAGVRHAAAAGIGSERVQPGAGGGDRGDQGDPRARLGLGAFRVVEELRSLSKTELENLGLTQADVDAVNQAAINGFPGPEALISFAEMIEKADSQSEWKNWYERHEGVLVELFGDEADLFQQILSATSQATGVAGNVTLAIKAYKQLKAGEPFAGYMPAVAGNLKRIRDGVEIQGNKIGEYGRANADNKDAVAVDRHIAELLFGTQNPSTRQVEKGKFALRSVARRMGWEPRQVQASLWAYNQVRKGVSPSSIASYDTFLKRKAKEIAEIRGVDEAPSFSRRGPVSPQSALDGAIDNATRDLEAAIRLKSKTVSLGRTPHVLNMLGAKPMSMAIDPSIIDKVFTGKHADELRGVSVKDVVTGMYRPSMIFKNPAYPNDYEMVLPVPTSGGPLTAIVVVDPADGQAKVKSIYARSWKVRKEIDGRRHPSLGDFVGDKLKSKMVYFDEYSAPIAVTGNKDFRSEADRASAMPGRPLNKDHFLSYKDFSVKDRAERRAAKTEDDLLRWIGDNYTGDMADAPSFSARQTETAAFKRWFGDSKVVDDEGKPLVVYHGTKADIAEFDPGRFGTGTDSGGWGRGFYFSGDPEYAGAYAGRADGSNIVPAYVSLKNPFVVDARERTAVIRSMGLEVPRGDPTPAWSQQLADALTQRGHDGVLVTLDGKPAEIVAFRPEQIKSAVGNDGNFDPADSDISRSARQPGQATPFRDELGRLRAPTGKLAAYYGGILNTWLAKVGLNYMSPELKRQFRAMKIQLQKAQEVTMAVAEQTFKMTEAERELVSDIVEGELKTGIVPPAHAVKMAMGMQAVLEQQTNELVSLGMLSQDSADMWRGKYLPRFYKPKLADTLTAWGKVIKELTGRKPIMSGIQGKRLKGRGLWETVRFKELAEWEDLGWTVRDPEFDRDTARPSTEVQVWRDFTPDERQKMGEIRDAGFRFAMGYQQAQRDIAYGRLFQGIAATMGSAKEKPGHVQVPDGTVEGTGVKRYGALAGMWVPEEVLQHLKAMDSGTSPAMRAYRKAMSLWKEAKTVLNPVSHANNVLSNISMAHFAGVSYWDGHKYLGAIRDLVQGGAMVQEAKEAGLFLGTMNQEELVALLPPELQKLANTQMPTAERAAETAWNLLSFWLRRPMAAAYEGEDLFFRFLIYRDARSKGMTPADAVDYSQRYIFTYDDLPITAQRIRDFGLPFFAYTYKVVPALLHTAANYPHRLLAPAAILYGLNAAMYAMAAGDDDEDWLEKLKTYATDPDRRAEAQGMSEEERANLPPWMKGAVQIGAPKAIRLHTDEVLGLPVFWDVGQIMPGGNLFDLQNNSDGVALPQSITPSHPLFTTFSAMLVNKDMFLGKEIVDKNDTSAEAASKRAEWLWRQFTPAIAYGNYHWERGLNIVAQQTGEPVRYWPWRELTGVDKQGMPITPGYAALQTVGIKVRPVDTERSAEMAKGQREALIRDIDKELRNFRRQNQAGFMSDAILERELERARLKKERLREGLTVDGEQPK
jgi:hypothetical protein